MLDSALVQLATLTPDPLCLLDDNLDIVWSNAPFATMWSGLTTTPGASIQRMADLVEPEISQRWLAWVARAQSGETFAVEEIVEHPQGRRFFVLHFGPVADDNGRMLAGVGAREITGTRRSERERVRMSTRFQTVLASAVELNRSIRDMNHVLNQTLNDLAATIECDTASIQLLEADQLKIVAHHGFDDDGISGLTFPLSPLFPNYHVIVAKQPLVLGDVRMNFPHFATEAREYDSGHIRTWMGIPLIAGDNIVGMVTMDRSNVQPFTAEDVELAVALANHAGVAIENAKLYGQIKRASNTKETLLRELHHRVKNNMQLVISLVNLRAGAVKSKPALVILDEIRARVTALATVHESLYRSEHADAVDLISYTQRIVQDVESGYIGSNEVLNIAFDSGPPIYADLDVAIPYGLLLSELLLNAVKHAFPGSVEEANVEVSILETGDRNIRLTVSDNGVGIAAKRDSGQASFGMTLVRSLADQLMGTAQVSNHNGTRWTVEFSAGKDRTQQESQASDSNRRPAHYE